MYPYLQSTFPLLPPHIPHFEQLRTEAKINWKQFCELRSGFPQAPSVSGYAKCAITLTQCPLKFIKYYFVVRGVLFDQTGGV
jgi:hypothetical protein